MGSEDEPPPFVRRIARDQIRILKAQAAAATRSLGLLDELKFDVLAAMQGIRPEMYLSPEDLSNLPPEEPEKLRQDLKAGFERVDAAAAAAAESLSLPPEKRYEVLRVLGQNVPPTGGRTFDETMEQRIRFMEEDVTRTTQELGLPEDRREQVLRLLYGQAGAAIRTVYRTAHPPEPGTPGGNNPQF